MIYIEDNETVPLPKKYHRLNNLCAIIYDQITEIFVSENYDDLNGTNITLDPENQALVEELQKDEVHILDWLKANELNDDLTLVLTKHISMSIISDLVNFIYESLSCAKKGKMTVAYALLRKPFTDELLILEQLLSDPHDFIERFYHSGNPDEYDPSARNIDKKEIIQKALRKTSLSAFFNEDLIYDLRYDKSCDSGINGISNHALHIVTKDKRYKTENQNLNFVFSNEDDLERYWNHYYYFVPYLLIYSSSVIDALIFRCLPDDDNQNLKAVKAFRRLVGIIFWTEWNNLDLKKSIETLLKSFSDEINLECPKCKNKLKLTKPDYKLFFESEVFLCSSCLENILTTKESVKPIKDFVDGYL